MLADYIVLPVDLVAILKIVAWPVIFLWVVLLLKTKVFELLLKKKNSLKGKGIELILGEVKESLSPMQLEKLGGLAAHDIWALETFVKRGSNTKIASMPTAIKWLR